MRWCCCSLLPISLCAEETSSHSLLHVPASHRADSQSRLLPCMHNRPCAFTLPASCPPHVRQRHPRKHGKRLPSCCNPARPASLVAREWHSLHPAAPQTKCPRCPSSLGRRVAPGRHIVAAFHGGVSGGLRQQCTLRASCMETSHVHMSSSHCDTRALSPRVVLAQSEGVVPLAQVAALCGSLVPPRCVFFAAQEATHQCSSLTGQPRFRCRPPKCCGRQQPSHSSERVPTAPCPRSRTQNLQGAAHHAVGEGLIRRAALQQRRRRARHQAVAGAAGTCHRRQLCLAGKPAAVYRVTEFRTRELPGGASSWACVHAGVCWCRSWLRPLLASAVSLV